METTTTLGNGTTTAGAPTVTACTCMRPNSCANCRTPEEEEIYWMEKQEDLLADSENNDD